MSLPDLLTPNLNIVICGTAVTKSSLAVEAYYANASNNLYATLLAVGLVNEYIAPSNYRELLKYRIGFTDLAKLRTGLDKELTANDFDVLAFERKVLETKPRIVCFNGKKAAAIYLGYKRTSAVTFGEQEKTLGDTKIFVAPSTSGQARRYYRIDYWQDLKSLV